MITLECDVRYHTGDAMLLRFNGVFGDEIWFPTSMVNNNGDGTVTMSRELAKRKGVEQYETKIL